MGRGGPEDGPGGSGPRAAPWSSSPGAEDRGLSLQSDLGRGRAAPRVSGRSCGKPGLLAPSWRSVPRFYFDKSVMYGVVASDYKYCPVGDGGRGPLLFLGSQSSQQLGSTDPRSIVRRQLRGEEGPKRDLQGLWAARPLGSPGPVARQRVRVW